MHIHRIQISLPSSSKEIQCFVKVKIKVTIEVPSDKLVDLLLGLQIYKKLK